MIHSFSGSREHSRAKATTHFSNSKIGKQGYTHFKVMVYTEPKKTKISQGKF